MIRSLLGDSIKDTVEGARGVPDTLLTAIREMPGVVRKAIADLVRLPLVALYGEDGSDTSSPADSAE